jgi:hypothetical protein
MATDFDYKAFRLLKAIYDLAGGSPGVPVGGADAAQKAGIDYSWEEYNPLVAHLEAREWVDSMGIVGGGVMLRITPEGVREVEEGGPPMYSA